MPRNPRRACSDPRVVTASKVCNVLKSPLPQQRCGHAGTPAAGTVHHDRVSLGHFAQPQAQLRQRYVKGTSDCATLAFARIADIDQRDRILSEQTLELAGGDPRGGLDQGAKSEWKRHIPADVQVADDVVRTNTGQPHRSELLVTGVDN